MTIHTRPRLMVEALSIGAPVCTADGPAPAGILHGNAEVQPGGFNDNGIAVLLDGVNFIPDASVVTLNVGQTYIWTVTTAGLSNGNFRGLLMRLGSTDDFIVTILDDNLRISPICNAQGVSLVFLFLFLFCGKATLEKLSPSKQCVG